MKKNLFFLFVACAVGMMSCSKENAIVEPQQEPSKETITFSASIDLNAETKASLSGLAIHWSASDLIAVANDVNDDIESCSVTPDGGDPTLCSFTATAVDGATTYYAICVGSSTDGIAFNHSTATFSGLNNARKGFKKGTMSGVNLAMAGKSTDKAHFTLKPCLSLFRIRIHEESVAAKYADGYSGISGFYFYMRHNDTKVYPAGDYTVNLASDMVVSLVDNANKVNNLKIAGDDSSLMEKDVDYYFTSIPVGTIEKMQYRFCGYTSEGERDWDTEMYGMTNRQTISVDPGDYFDCGTINPVGAKKADDTFSPAITIDGSFTDWSGSGVVAGVNTSSKITSWKYTSDAKYIYFYAVVPKTALTYDSTRNGYRKENYFYVGFDFDSNSGTGSGSASGGLGSGYNARAVVYPYKGEVEGTIEYIVGKDDRSSTAYSPTATNSSEWDAASSWETIYTAAVASGDNTIVEFSVPRSKIGFPSAGAMEVNLSFNYSAIGRESITIN